MRTPIVGEIFTDKFDLNDEIEIEIAYKVMKVTGHMMEAAIIGIVRRNLRTGEVQEMSEEDVRARARR